MGAYRHFIYCLYVYRNLCRIFVALRGDLPAEEAEDPLQSGNQKKPCADGAETTMINSFQLFPGKQRIVLWSGQEGWGSWCTGRRPLEPPVGILLDAAKYKLNSQLSAPRCPNGYFKAVDSWNWNAAAAAPFKNFDSFSSQSLSQQSLSWLYFHTPLPRGALRMPDAQILRYTFTQILGYTDTDAHTHIGRRRPQRDRLSCFRFLFLLTCGEAGYIKSCLRGNKLLKPGMVQGLGIVTP